MKAIGWSVLVAAVLLHFSICEWDGTNQLIGFIAANSSVGLPRVASILLGIVAPVLMIGVGMALVMAADREAKQ